MQAFTSLRIDRRSAAFKLALAVFAAFAVITPLRAQQQQNVYKEDINGDTRVDLRDVLELLLLGRRAPADPKADFDSSGTFTLLDIRLLLQHLRDGKRTVVVVTLPPPLIVNKTWEVQMRDNLFSPDSLAITVGDTIRWVNAGNMAHTATSGPNGVKDGIWDSGYLNTGQSYSRVFNQAGQFPYYCIPHYFFGMTGKVAVLAKASSGL